MPEINSTFLSKATLFGTSEADLALNLQTKNRYPLKLEFDPTELGYPDSRQRPAEIRLTDNQIELQTLKQLGLDINSKDNLELVKKRLHADNPFAAMNTTGPNIARYNDKTGKYELNQTIEKNLYAKLKGWTERINIQVAIEKRNIESSAQVSAVTDPNAPKTVKDFVILPKEGQVTTDRTLFWQIKDKFGKGNLQIDSFQRIFDRAKLNGIDVKINDVQPFGRDRKVSFEMSVSDAAKLEQIYQEEQATVNKAIASADHANRNTPAQKFAEGFFKGAWGSLKGNAELVYEAAKDPLGAAWKVGEALVSVPQLATKIGIGVGQAAAELAKMTPAERQNLINELVSKGYTSLRDMPVEVAAEKAGEIVGTIAMEAVLGKGASIGLNGLKALSATKSGAAFIKQIEGLASAAKQAIAETKVPVKVTAEVLADAAGGTTPIVNVEKKSFGELLNQMMSQAKDTAKSSEKLEMLEKGSTAGKDVLTETVEQGLTEKAQASTKRLKGNLSKEELKAAKEQLVTLNVARTEMMARLDEMAKDVNLSPNARDIAERARNAIRDHGTQDDLAGALRDVHNKPVVRSGSGKIYDHLGEVENNALKPLRTLRDKLINEMTDGAIKQAKSANPNFAEYQRLSKEVNALSEMINRIESFLEIGK